MDNISVQFDKIISKAMPKIETSIFLQMDSFGEAMLKNITPFSNLTGNTITSFSYGIYINGELEQIGLYDGKEAIRTKLTKDEIFTGVDYDGKYRKYFKATISTDSDYGKNTSINFLSNYAPKSKYAIVFTTGTEYSEFNKNIVDSFTNLKVMSISSFVQSFKPIEI